MSKVVAELENQTSATSPYNSGTFSTLGVEPHYSELRTIPIGEGRFFKSGDERESAQARVYPR